jgi:hypothetical protein
VRRQTGPRRGSPEHTHAIAAMTSAQGNSHRSITAAQGRGEREPDLGRPKRRKHRRRSLASDNTGDTLPNPIYTPHAQIRGSPTPPPPERAERGRGTHGGAGETGGRPRPPSQASRSTVAEGRGERLCTMRAVFLLVGKKRSTASLLRQKKVCSRSPHRNTSHVWQPLAVRA